MTERECWSFSDIELIYCSLLAEKEGKETFYSKQISWVTQKQGDLTPDDQTLVETDEAIEIIDVSEYKPRLIPSKQWRD